MLLFRKFRILNIYNFKTRNFAIKYVSIIIFSPKTNKIVNMKITGCNLGNLIYTQSSYGNLMKANVNFIEISIQFYFIQ